VTAAYLAGNSKQATDPTTSETPREPVERSSVSAPPNSSAGDGLRARADRCGFQAGEVLSFPRRCCGRAVRSRRGTASPRIMVNAFPFCVAASRGQHRMRPLSHVTTAPVDRRMRPLQGRLSCDMFCCRRAACCNLSKAGYPVSRMYHRIAIGQPALLQPALPSCDKSCCRRAACSRGPAAAVGRLPLFEGCMGFDGG
jgi:hypothetical protein